MHTSVERMIFRKLVFFPREAPLNVLSSEPFILHLKEYEFRLNLKGRKIGSFDSQIFSIDFVSQEPKRDISC